MEPVLDPKRFAQRAGSWLSGAGPESDVVVSCRMRLARNLEGFPFVLRLDDAKAREVSPSACATCSSASTSTARRSGSGWRRPGDH
jgi:protein arginine kinase